MTISCSGTGSTISFMLRCVRCGLRALEGSFRRKTKKEKKSKTGVKRSKAHPPYSCEITPALPGLKAKIRLTKLLMTPAPRLEILSGAWSLYEEPAPRSRPLQPSSSTTSGRLGQSRVMAEFYFTWGSTAIFGGPDEKNRGACAGRMGRDIINGQSPRSKAVLLYI